MYNKKISYSALLILMLGISAFLNAQTPENPVKPVIIAGDVTAVSPAQISITTKDGAVAIDLGAKTEFKRVSAEKPSLQTATAAALADISVGDKVAISVIFDANKKPQPARTVFLMTKADITQRNTKDSEEWKTRGIAGRVTAVDQLAGKITVEQRGMVGSTSIIVTPKESIRYLRYAPDSIKFSEARESTISDLKPGDMMRALGDKGADGTTFAAEEIVSGAFQTHAGTVKSIDAVKNEVVVTDLATKKDVTIAIIPTSVLKQFPQDMAQRMAQLQMGGQGGGFRPAGAGNNPPAAAQTNSANPAGPRPGFGGARGGGIDDMLDRFPNITAADLKVGDIIAVSSTRGDTLDRITAIKLLSGVEPFLRAAQMSAASRGGRQDRTLDLNIPGLDGFGTP
jgi:hypothetical protein